MAIDFDGGAFLGIDADLQRHGFQRPVLVGGAVSKGRQFGIGQVHQRRHVGQHGLDVAGQLGYHGDGEGGAIVRQQLAVAVVDQPTLRLQGEVLDVVFDR